MELGPRGGLGGCGPSCDLIGAGPATVIQEGMGSFSVGALSQHSHTMLAWLETRGHGGFPPDFKGRPGNPGNVCQGQNPCKQPKWGTLKP